MDLLKQYKEWHFLLSGFIVGWVVASYYYNIKTEKIRHRNQDLGQQIRVLTTELEEANEKNSKLTYQLEDLEKQKSFLDSTVRRARREVPRANT